MADKQDGGNGVTYEKLDPRSTLGHSVNSLSDVSSNSPSSIVGGVAALGAGHVLMKDELIPSGSAAARAFGAV